MGWTVDNFSLDKCSHLWQNVTMLARRLDERESREPLSHKPVSAESNQALRAGKSESMSIRLPLSLYQTIKDIAIAEGRTIANTIRRLLTEAIERRDER